MDKKLKSKMVPMGASCLSSVKQACLASEKVLTRRRPPGRGTYKVIGRMGVQVRLVAH